MRKKKALFVTEYFYPSESSTSVFMTGISSAVSNKSNCSIKVICNVDLEGQDELQFSKNNIIRLSGSRLSKNNLFLRVFRLVSNTLKLGWYTLFEVNTDTKLFAVTNPAFLVLVLGVIRKFKNFEYILLVYDIFPENLVSAKILKSNSILYIFLKKLFDWAYSQTDHLVVIGRDMQQLINEKTRNSIPTSLITNWCDIDNIRYEPKHENQIIKNLNLQSNTVFSFVGNLGRVQGIDFLLDIAELVKNPNFILLFIGGGALLPNIKQHIEQSKKNNVIYAGFFPSSDQNMILNSCDVSIVSLNKSMYGLGVPSKTYNNMAAKKPILYIGDKDSEIGLVVKENKVGWIFDTDNAKKVADKIDLIIDNKDEVIFFGENARDLAIKEFSKEKVLKKYVDLFESSS